MKFEQIIQVADQKESAEEPIMVYTHGGKFHLDEVAAIAILRHFVGKVDVKHVPHDTQVEAITRNVRPGTVVILVDVGGEWYTPDWEQYVRACKKQSGGLPKPVICDHHGKNILNHSAEILLKYLARNGLVQQIDIEALTTFVCGVSERDRGLHKNETLPNIADIISEMNFQSAVDFVYQWVFNLRLQVRAEKLRMYSYVETAMVMEAKKHGYSPDNVDFVFLPMLNEKDELVLVPVIPTEEPCAYYAREAINLHGTHSTFVFNSWKHTFTTEAIDILWSIFKNQIESKSVQLNDLYTKRTVIIKFLDGTYKGNAVISDEMPYYIPVAIFYERLYDEANFTKIWDVWNDKTQDNGTDWDIVNIDDLLTMRGTFNDGNIQVRLKKDEDKG